MDRHAVDFVVVAQPGRLPELWAARHAIAEGLGGWLGGFDEVASQAPHTFIGFCDGPVKVDFFFQETEPAADPWLRDGFRALVDPDGVADPLRRALAADPPPPDFSEFDVHAWDLAMGDACQTAPARAELVNALPTRPEEAELRRAVGAAVDSYLALRPRLAAERNMPLAEELAQQVLGVLRPEQHAALRGRRSS